MKSVLSGIKLLVFLYILSFIEAVKSDEYDLCDTEICGWVRNTSTRFPSGAPV